MIIPPTKGNTGIVPPWLRPQDPNEPIIMGHPDWVVFDTVADLFDSLKEKVES